MISVEDAPFIALQIDAKNGSHKQFGIDFPKEDQKKYGKENASTIKTKCLLEINVGHQWDNPLNNAPALTPPSHFALLCPDKMYTRLTMTASRIMMQRGFLSTGLEK